MARPPRRILDLPPRIDNQPPLVEDLTQLLHVRAGHFFGPPIRPLVHALKYQGLWTIGSVLGARTAERLGPWRDIDAVVPVPMHPARRRERGYDQVRLVAEGLAHRANLPPLRHWLRKRVHTPSQTGLELDERQRNVCSSFAVRGGQSGARVLLVDDVITSGATLVAAADALQQAGIVVIEAVTVAETPMGQQTTSRART